MDDWGYGSKCCSTSSNFKRRLSPLSLPYTFQVHISDWFAFNHLRFFSIFGFGGVRGWTAYCMLLWSIALLLFLFLLLFSFITNQESIVQNHAFIESFILRFWYTIFFLLYFWVITYIESDNTFITFWAEKIVWGNLFLCLPRYGCLIKFGLGLFTSRFLKFLLILLYHILWQCFVCVSKWAHSLRQLFSKVRSQCNQSLFILCGS